MNQQSKKDFQNLKMLNIFIIFIYEQLTGYAKIFQ